MRSARHSEPRSRNSLLIAQHSEVQEALREEAAVLNGRLPAVGDLPRLPYVERVLSESMRLYPPTWIYVRMARGADRLPSGVEVPAGTKLYLCPWVIHRSERYFESPLEFDPTRFEGAARKERPRYAYFPFGGGPRVCIGEALAETQMLLTLVMLAQRFRVELLPDQTIEPDPKITLHPHPGIRLRLNAYLERRSLSRIDGQPTATDTV